MDAFNAKPSPDEHQKLIAELRAENAALRGKNTTLHQTCGALRERLTAAETERAQAQAELSTLTDAAQVLQEDRETLRNKIAELQAAVDRLTNMLWGRRSEKRINPNVAKNSSCREGVEELQHAMSEVLAGAEG
jgi:chromosome segregation ATPase